MIICILSYGNLKLECKNLKRRSKARVGYNRPWNKSSLCGEVF